MSANMGVTFARWTPMSREIQSHHFALQRLLHVHFTPVIVQKVARTSFTQ
jgi:hypothetical protein